MADRKAVIKNADMAEDMQQDAIDCATQALEKYNIEKDIAAFIKKEFDKKYNPTWHAIVGRNFGRCAPLPHPNLFSLAGAAAPRDFWLRGAKRRPRAFLPAAEAQGPGPAPRFRRAHSLMHSRTQCTRRLVRDARDEALHLFLLGKFACVLRR